MTFRIVPVNAIDSATLSVTPSAVSTLPLTNLQSNIRDRVWRSPNLEQQVILGNWGGNVRRLSHFSVWSSAQSSSLIGSKWRLEVFSDLAMASSVLDQTWDFFTFSGTAWGTDAWGVFQWGVADDDRTARLAPLSKWFSAVNASAFRITVTNGGAVDTPYFEARRIWLGEYQQAPTNAQYGAAPQWASSSQQERISSTLRRMRRGRWRELPFDAVVQSEADRAKWSDIVYVCDPANEVVVALFPADAATRRERDFTVMGSVKVSNPMPYENYNFHRMRFEFTES